jgi:hypothetical protein
MALSLACAQIVAAAPWFAVPAFAQVEAAQGDVSKPTAQQMQELVAPIALYPDALVAQILAASIHPTEFRVEPDCPGCRSERSVVGPER